MKNILPFVENYLQQFKLIIRGQPIHLKQSQYIILIGSAGDEFFEIFKKSQYYKNFYNNKNNQNHANPLDKWSQNIIDSLCSQLKPIKTQALYPFTKNPIHPFQSWAITSEPIFQSPLGILIHPQYGLWHAYRGAIKIISENLSKQQYINTNKNQPHIQSPIQSPCQNCADKPCLTTCPANAFSTESYNTSLCLKHLQSNQAQNCFNSACLARRACPEAKQYAYGQECSQFLLESFQRQLMRII